jgi:hypothetical protein
VVGAVILTFLHVSLRVEFYKCFLVSVQSALTVSVPRLGCQCQRGITWCTKAARSPPPVSLDSKPNRLPYILQIGILPCTEYLPTRESIPTESRINSQFCCKLQRRPSSSSACRLTTANLRAHPPRKFQTLTTYFSTTFTTPLLCRLRYRLQRV